MFCKLPPSLGPPAPPIRHVIAHLDVRGCMSKLVALCVFTIISSSAAERFHLVFHDPSRGNRTVEVDVCAPSPTNGSEHLPLLVFSHVSPSLVEGCLG